MLPMDTDFKEEDVIGVSTILKEILERYCK
jgi:hypothetical protein